MAKWKVMLMEQFFEVDADTEEDARNEAAASVSVQTMPEDFVVLGPADSADGDRGA